MSPLIGVLGLQGGFVEHVHSLESLGARTIVVKRPAHLDGLDGIVLPGGESTTMSKLLELGGLLEPLRAAINQGLPTFGTCAGFILLAEKILDTRADAHCLSGLNISIRRNAFGRQTESFETVLNFAGITDQGDEPGVHAVFIRAPKVEEVGPGVEILSSLSDGTVVAVRQENIIGCSFHPELTDDNRIHRYFVEMVTKA